MRKLLELAIKVPASVDDTLKSSDLIRLRAKTAEELCGTLFSPGENKMFIGESLLHTASQEND